jgi:hypothetical protein
VSKVDHTGFYLIYESFTQASVIGLGDVTFLDIAHEKPSENVGKTNFLPQAIQEPDFSVANTDFEGGDSDIDCGCGDCIFLVI